MGGQDAIPLSSLECGGQGRSRTADASLFSSLSLPFFNNLTLQSGPQFCDHSVTIVDVRLSVGPNLNGADVVVRTLEERGVTHVFGRPSAVDRSRAALRNIATDHAFSGWKSRLDVLRHVNGIQFFGKRLLRHSQT